jgi:UDP-GlcNAc:undecaprenyl-phosphate/decaprenyl-phosphate GlcNAc-1-phosphate transferase
LERASKKCYPLSHNFTPRSPHLKSFVLSSRELSKLAIMALLATAAFGLSGLIMILIMQLMTMQSYAADSVDKHGISEVQSSRLGGVAVAIGVLVSMGFLLMNGYRGSNTLAPLGIFWPLWLGACGCFFLGLLEDLRNNSLSPRARLTSKSLLLLVVFILSPDLVASSIGLWGIDWLLGFSWVAMLVTLFFSVGFVNAVNTVDGANGLVSGIFVISCFIFSNEIGGIALQSGLYGASLFLIFNVISGRLFLGDAGSYGLGSAMLLSGLVAYNMGVVSLPFLAALYFYPCADFSVSLLRRWHSGASLTAPDNDHLHNRINTFFQRIFRSKNMGNSATGLSIALGSSGLVLFIYLADYIPLTSNLWLWMFALQSVLYGLIFMSIGKPK